MNARILLAVVIVILSVNVHAAQSSKYLDAVREFADNVLKYGRDTYGPKHTPLFADGLNIHTHEPVRWLDPDGTKWILSNFASQQTLLRTLDGRNYRFEAVVGKGSLTPVRMLTWVDVS